MVSNPVVILTFHLSKHPFVPTRSDTDFLLLTFIILVYMYL